LRKIFPACLLAVSLSLLAPGQGPGLAQELVLDSLIAESLRANPNLAAAKLRYQAFEAKVPQAGAWPDPMFKTVFSNIPTDSWPWIRRP
jgi:outer membrane protein TolC